MTDMSLVSIGATACALSVLFWWKAMKAHREHQVWCDSRLKADGIVSRLGSRGDLSRNQATTSGPSFSDDNVTQNARTVAVVRFTASNGAEYEIDAPEVATEVGVRVPAAYDSRMPSDARAVKHTPKIGCAVFPLLAGVALIVAGLLQ